MTKFYIILMSIGILAGCQQPKPPEQANQNTVSLGPERRAAIDTCLVQIGKSPLPKILGGINAPMNRTEAKAFEECMAQ